MLLLLLKIEPKVVEYFSSMAGSFRLYVGTDILVRALSELYLAEESRVTTNLLKILRSAGSELVLTETTVQELATHIRSQIYEFENVYANTEHLITPEIVPYVPKILIRSYFYAKILPVDGIAGPKSWRSYIENFCSFSDLRRNRADDELADFLMKKFGMVYEFKDQSLADLNGDELEGLKESILAARDRPGKGRDNEEILAYNDAMQVLRVYGRRDEGRESSPGSPFGYKTWWLTQDSKVRRAAGDIVLRRKGQPFMMRPEFLLNYIALAPKMAKVKESYKTIFPSALGIKLSYGINETEFRKVMKDASGLSGVDDARASALVNSEPEVAEGRIERL